MCRVGVHIMHKSIADACQGWPYIMVIFNVNIKLYFKLKAEFLAVRAFAVCPAGLPTKLSPPISHFQFRNPVMCFVIKPELQTGPTGKYFDFVFETQTHSLVGFQCNLICSLNYSSLLFQIGRKLRIGFQGP